MEEYTGLLILQIIPAQDGWIEVDADDRRFPVIAWALVEYPTGERLVRAMSTDGGRVVRLWSHGMICRRCPRDLEAPCDS